MMTAAATWIVAAWLTSSTAALLTAALGVRGIRRLGDEPIPSSHPTPSVSIVVAARDEARHLEAALDSFLGQDYTPLEVIVVDDRSTDRTGAIADAFARRDWRVTVLHLTALPEGWLGKNHALDRGAETAQGEFLLFTDADVVFAPGTLARAMQAVASDRLDHLAVVPGITSPSRAVGWYVGAVSIFFLLFTRAWQVGNPRRSASIGVGAFNLVRTARYRAAGGHRPIRLRPDDELRLGRSLKRHGARAGVRLGPGAVEVDWYASFGDLVRGLEKNAFAGLDYSVARTVAAVGAMVAHGAAFAVPALVGGLWRIAVITALGLMVAAGTVGARAVGQPAGCAILQPVATLVSAWIQCRATALTIARGGIRWRGTFYPLALLRSGREQRQSVK
jgi:cellulose synthase/poly-beta-1,6-N-acetylglucosamine synthase-like glycosyltransferase